MDPNLLLLESLLDEIRRMQQLQQEVIEGQKLFASQSPQTTFDLRAIASIISDVFQGAETAFLRISKVVDGQVVSGKHWHLKLLQQMYKEVPNVRPAILTKETYDSLEQYRGFRHMARHNYGSDLRWEKMEPLLATADHTIQLLINDLEAFCQFLELLSSGD